MKRWRRKALLAKIEAAYGVDAVPTGVANGMTAMNVTLRPLEGGEVTREIDQPHLGAKSDILINTHVGIDFEIEIAGGGAVDTPPAYGPLLRACGLAETITAVTSVEYDPVSDGFESVTIYLNIDGVLHKLLGARGTVGLTLAPGGLPRYRFTFLGLFVAATDTALPTVDESAFQQPLTVSDANTTTFTIDGFAGVLENLTIDYGNDTQGRFLVNSESIEIVDRIATGTALIEKPTLAAKDFFDLARQKTKVVLQLVHGTVAGNIVTIDAPTVEVGRPTYEQSQGIVMLSLPLKFIPNAGDDEIKITTT